MIPESLIMLSFIFLLKFQRKRERSLNNPNHLIFILLSNSSLHKILDDNVRMREKGNYVLFIGYKNNLSLYYLLMMRSRPEEGAVLRFLSRQFLETVPLWRSIIGGVWSRSAACDSIMLLSLCRKRIVMLRSVWKGGWSPKTRIPTARSQLRGKS